MSSKNLFTSLLFTGLFFFISCTDPGKNNKQPEIFQYIYGHTSGTISSSSMIEVYLEKIPDKKFQEGQSLPDGILTFSPKIKGRLVLEGEKTLQFIPDERLKNGQAYEANLDLGAIMEVPKAYKHFKFKFSVVELKASFSPGNLIIRQDDDTLEYVTNISTSDYIVSQELEAKVAADQNGRKLPIEWQHMNNSHQLTVKNITKTDENSTLNFVFDKKLISQENYQVIIPGRNVFSVMNVGLSNNDRKSVRVDMSENIDPEQDMNGLVTISGISGIRYKTENNSIYLYFDIPDDQENLEVTIHKGIRSNNGHSLQADFSEIIPLPSTSPAVKFIGKGIITPAAGKVLIPFSAVALKAIDLQVIKVFHQNMNFFLQRNNYAGVTDLVRTARPVFQKKIELSKPGEAINLNRWNDFSINLSDLVELEKGVIYRIEIRFKRSYTTLECANEGKDEVNYYKQNWDGGDYYYNDYYYSNDYNWEERDNPCSDSYYNSSHFTNRSIINTSLGILAKRSVNNQYFIAVNDIASAEPIEKCTVVLYDFQNQRIDSVKTDKNGFAYIQPESKAFIIMAKKGNDKAWLKVSDENALSLSNFDVSGQNVQSGLKGFIYGERGVWRPGDDIYLSFILENKLNMLPNGHPIIAQLTDPKGNVIQTKKSVVGDRCIHCFKFNTTQDAPTGYWNATVKAGGTSFSKTLRIETIKPNRLSINMEFPNDQVVGNGISNSVVQVKTRWLNGAPTPHRKAITEVRLHQVKNTFKSFQHYSFDNMAENFTPYSDVLFDGTTNAEGNFSFNLDKIHTENAPGMLNASFTTRVFEESGDFSIATYTTLYSPYKQYVGIKLQDSDDGWLPTNKPVKLDGVLVSPLGQKVNSSGSTVNVKVYEISWRWWWDSENDGNGTYINRSYNNLVVDKDIKTSSGNFSSDFKVERYGRYFVQVTDKVSGHSSGIIAWFGSWADNANSDMATVLSISTDKGSYNPGEKIKVKIPSSSGGTAIFSLENGMTFRDIRRVATTDGYTIFEVEATSEMCPNVYIGATLIQPQSDRKNDRPVRMYGVVNINVDDPALHLDPVIKMAPELRPGREFTVSVSEKNQKAMDYTIAIVDEGLLSITSFRTPNPYPVFYAREALGIKTWDFYDYIFGSFGARLEKAFAIGGDEAMKAVADEKTNRFKPVVLFEGPFSLKKGESQTHKFIMPEYIGEVRAMVVAGSCNGKYGSVSANALVKQPLMISAAMPRAFTPGDEIEVPVTVFAMNNSIRKVDVTIDSDSKIEVVGGNQRTADFTKEGEKIVWFKLRINRSTGKSVLKFSASSGNEQAATQEQVEIRLPNPRITQVEAKILKAGESVRFEGKAEGADPRSILEIASIPPLNLGQRLEYLIAYPHGCAEQITSAAFPQLSLGQLTELSPQQKNSIETNVKTVISKLSRYQTPEGGFAYWPGGRYTSDWVSIYIAHFLISANKFGYSVPTLLLQKDLNYLKVAANNSHIASEYDEMLQAYRLYVLALAGKADQAAMNRMKSAKLYDNTAQWLLASAYALCGQKNIARNIIRNVSSNVNAYNQTGDTYGSDTRDKAIILQAMVSLDMQQDAYQMLEQIAGTLSSGQWLSTQSTAFALLAATDYVEKYVGKLEGINVEIKTGERKEAVKINKTIYQQILAVKNGQSQVQVTNSSSSTLYVRQINSSTPFGVVTEQVMSGLSMSVKYYNDKSQPVRIDSVQQGTDITAEISVTNTGLTGAYSNLALSYLLPSGFEIINDRLTGNTQAFKDADYIDIRDDRFYLYFGLNERQTKIFRFRFNAAFAGEYIRPAIQCSAMYNNAIEAVLPGGRVRIIR